MTTYYLKSQLKQFVSSTGIVLMLVLGVTMVNSMNSTLLMQSEVAKSSQEQKVNDTKVVKTDVKKTVKKSSNSIGISIYN